MTGRPMTDAVMARERIDAQLAILAVIEAERTDRRLAALGYPTPPRRRWPKERTLAELTGRTPAGSAGLPYLTRPYRPGLTDVHIRG